MHAHSAYDMAWDDANDDNDAVGMGQSLSYKWAIKPLDKGKVDDIGRAVPQTQGYQDIITAMNQFLFEYQDTQVSDGRDIDSLTDGEIVHAVAQYDANRRDIAKGNSLQWIGRNCRVIKRDEDIPGGLYTEDEVEDIVEDVKKQAYEDGFERGYDRAKSSE